MVKSWRRAGLGVTKPIFSIANFLLYIITFIFDRCHHSSDAETPNKYERDLKYPTYTFVKPFTKTLYMHDVSFTIQL